VLEPHVGDRLRRLKPETKGKLVRLYVESIWFLISSMFKF
jgi:hypothetical protein